MRGELLLGTPWRVRWCRTTSPDPRAKGRRTRRRSMHWRRRHVAKGPGPRDARTRMCRPRRERLLWLGAICNVEGALLFAQPQFVGSTRVRRRRTVEVNHAIGRQRTPRTTFCCDAPRAYLVRACVPGVCDRTLALCLLPGSRTHEAPCTVDFLILVVSPNAYSNRSRHKKYSCTGVIGVARANPPP